MQDLETVEKVIKGDTFLNMQLPQPVRSAAPAPAHQANWLLVLALGHASKWLASVW